MILRETCFAWTGRIYKKVISKSNIQNIKHSKYTKLIGPPRKHIPHEKALSEKKQEKAKSISENEGISEKHYFKSKYTHFMTF